MVLIPPVEPRRWGKQRSTRADGSLNPRFVQRYNRLKSEGFDEEECRNLAEGIIGSSAMRAGRKARRAWYRGLVKQYGRRPTEDELAELTAELYVLRGWIDPWDMFYQEEGGED
jgi:hypothetical protein